MAEERSGRTLNPFAFPSETELRSVLLIWAVLVLCWAIGFVFTGIVLSNAGWPWPDELPDLERDIWGTRTNAENLSLPAAMVRSETILAEKLAALSQPEERKRTQDALSRLSGAARRKLNVTLPYLLIPFLFVLLTVLVIWGYSLGRARRLWFVRLARTKPWEIEALQETLNPLVEEARSLQLQLGEKEVARPKFLLSRGARADGQAYGSSRRPLIVLSRAVPLILRKEIRSHGKAYKVRAILLHELAHLANRDVTRSYLAEASWIVLIPVLAFLAAVLWMTWVSVDGAKGEMQNPAVISLQVLGTLLVVELIRRGVLRGREHFADLRAGVLWKVIGPLRASLQPENGSETGTLARLWSKHPDTAERRKVLDDPGLVFAIRNDAALLAGVLFGNLLVSAALLTGMLVMATDGAAGRLKWMARASAVLLLPLVVALMGAQLWIWPAVRSVDGRSALAFGFFGLLIFVSLLVLMLFVLGIWQAGREGTRKPRCPSCRHDPGGTTVADRCAACGGSLAPWLYVAGHDMEGAPI